MAKGRNGYDLAYQWDCGLIIMRNSKRNDMGIHLIYSGEVLRHIQANYGLDGFEIINWYQSKSTNYSRIDLALDAFNFNCPAEYFNNLVVQDKCSNKRASKLFIKNHNNKGDTLYIGSLKKRKRLLRIYDKGKQTGEHDDWTRFEIQLSGGYGNSVIRHLSNKMEAKSMLVQGIIKDWADFPDDALWNEIFTSKNVSLDTPMTPESDTEKWLIDTVAKSLAKVTSSKPEFMHKFLTEWQIHMTTFEILNKDFFEG